MLRKATSKDFDFVYNLYFHPQVNPFLLYEIMDKRAFKLIFKDLVSKEIKFIFEEDGEAIGMFKLFGHTYRASHICYLGGVAIHPDYSGKGYGVKMLREILAHVQQKGFLRIELSVATLNLKAIALYEKLGFEREGILKKYTHLKSENRFIDEMMMAYIF